jgi:hypothetical protein
VKRKLANRNKVLTRMKPSGWGIQGMKERWTAKASEHADPGVFVRLAAELGTELYRGPAD